MTVQKLLKQRHARKSLFSNEVIGLRSDLSLRRELRKPLDKVNMDALYYLRIFAPDNLITVYKAQFKNTSLFYENPFKNHCRTQKGKVIRGHIQ